MGDLVGVLQNVLPGALGVLAVWNAIAFSVMGWDKRQAKIHGRRVPEKTLFLFAFCLAGPGIFLGMSLFHHKTKHRSFQIGVPVGILVNCLLIGLVFYRLIV